MVFELTAHAVFTVHVYFVHFEVECGLLSGIESVQVFFIVYLFL